jgi:hypothetical protein
MSVTFASGIIPTSVSIRLVINISRFSVTTKYLRHQLAIFQPCHANSANHRIQIIFVNPILLGPEFPVTMPTPIRPARIRNAGRTMAIGCIRTRVTTCSLGMRYSLTMPGRWRTLTIHQYTNGTIAMPWHCAAHP